MRVLQRLEPFDLLSAARLQGLRSVRYLALAALVACAGCIDLDDAPTACAMNPARCGGDSSVADTAIGDSAGLPDADSSADSAESSSDVCTRGAIYCTDATLKKCSADGQSWTVLETCATPELCAAGKPGGCAPPACAAGEKKCSGLDLQVCNVGRTAFNLERTCGVSCESATCLGAMSVTAGGLHTCSLLSDGSTRCWGNNGFGQLGDGTRIARLSPVVAGGSFEKSVIASGADNVCVIAKDGSVQCWGTDIDGQLLGGGLGAYSTTPVKIGTITGGVAVAVGETHACAASGDGKTFCWGTNEGGQLGNGTTTPTTSTPAYVGTGWPAIGLATGAGHTCAISDANDLSCWGTNASGAVGDGTVGIRKNPSGPILGGVREVSAGRSHTCALLADSSVYCWGDNTFGQLGDGTTTQRGTPSVVPALKASHVSAGQHQNCAVLTDGTVKCWGKNADGQLGDGTTTNQHSPTAVGGITNAAAIGSGWAHTCVGLTGGSLLCWGNNSAGQLGDGTKTPRLSPGAVKW